MASAPKQLETKWTPGPWEVGQHPAVPNAWIVRPVLFGHRVRVLPECEGSHVCLRNEYDANLIAAAPDMVAALKRMAEAWSNAVELGLIPSQHVNTANILRDECLALLARIDTRQCGDCDGDGKVWNNADPTSGQWVACEACGVVS